MGYVVHRVTAAKHASACRSIQCHAYNATVGVIKETASVCLLKWNRFRHLLVKVVQLPAHQCSCGFLGPVIS
jgi:hypothetical protein